MKRNIGWILFIGATVGGKGRVIPSSGIHPDLGNTE